jgi:hypothetical protein
MERENLAGDAKGKGTSGSNREAESTDAPLKFPGPTRHSRRLRSFGRRTTHPKLANSWLACRKHSGGSLIRKGIKALDEVPQAVSVLVIGDLRDARFSRRDHSLDFNGHQLGAKLVIVETLVGNHAYKREALD